MGTLTDNIAGAVAELRQGRVEFKMDRTGIVHAPIGKAAFDPQALYLNMGALTGAPAVLPMGMAACCIVQHTPKLVPS
jgi:large subunit ribosomal protein L1